MADSSSPLSFQWKHGTANMTDNGNVSGSTTAQLTIYNVGPADAGRYTVVVSNARGSVIGRPATLKLEGEGRPKITQQPQNQSATSGDDVSFYVQVASDTPCLYLWKHNGADLTDGGNVQGSASYNLTLYNVGPDDAGAYSVVVSNSKGSVSSRSVRLKLAIAPYIISEPTDQIYTGRPVSFSVRAGGTAPLRYQWYVNKGYYNVPLSNGHGVSGARSPHLVLSPGMVTVGAYYTVFVENAVGSVASDPAYVR